MRVKPGSNRALQGLYSGWYESSRANGVANKFQEEIECEQLSAEFVKRLSWHQPGKCNPRLQELFGKYQISVKDFYRSKIISDLVVSLSVFKIRSIFMF